MSITLIALPVPGAGIKDSGVVNDVRIDAVGSFTVLVMISSVAVAGTMRNTAVVLDKISMSWSCLVRSHLLLPVVGSTF